MLRQNRTASAMCGGTAHAVWSRNGGGKAMRRMTEHGRIARAKCDRPYQRRAAIAEKNDAVPRTEA
eukprot:2918037-Rhodomonas_salina.3